METEMQEPGLSIIIIFFSSVLFCLHESGKMISLSFFLPFE